MSCLLMHAVLLGFRVLSRLGRYRRRLNKRLLGQMPEGISLVYASL